MHRYVHTTEKDDLLKVGQLHGQRARGVRAQ